MTERLRTVEIPNKVAVSPRKQGFVRRNDKTIATLAATIIIAGASLFTYKAMNNEFEDVGITRSTMEKTRKVLGISLLANLVLPYTLVYGVAYGSRLSSRRKEEQVYEEPEREYKKETG